MSEQSINPFSKRQMPKISLNDVFKNGNVINMSANDSLEVKDSQGNIIIRLLNKNDKPSLLLQLSGESILVDPQQGVKATKSIDTSQPFDFVQRKDLGDGSLFEIANPTENASSIKTKISGDVLGRGQIVIGRNSEATAGNSSNGIAIGTLSKVITGDFGAIAIGPQSEVSHTRSISLGARTKTFRSEEVSLSRTDSNNSSDNKYLAGIKDPENDYDAANKKYVHEIVDNNSSLKGIKVLGTAFNNYTIKSEDDTIVVVNDNPTYSIDLVIPHASSSPKRILRFVNHGRASSLSERYINTDGSINVNGDLPQGVTLIQSTDSGSDWYKIN